MDGCVRVDGCDGPGGITVSGGDGRDEGCHTESHLQSSRGAASAAPVRDPRRRRRRRPLPLGRAGWRKRWPVPEAAATRPMALGADSDERSAPADGADGLSGGGA